MGVSIQARGLFSLTHMNGGLKSNQERAERQQKCDSQVNFFEKQKENLKNMECTTLEDIARKLEMFHSYEDQIAEAKKQFNNSQMMHVLDEAKEIGEKIAEKAKEMAPKTEEELREERTEKALGTEEESKGMLTEVMEEMAEMMEEMQEELEEKLDEELAGELDGELNEELEELSEPADLDEEPAEEAGQAVNGKAAETLDESTVQVQAGQNGEALMEAVEERIIQERAERKAEEEARKENKGNLIFQTEDWRSYPHIDYRL